jgi:lysophospholipase L1-like esterase
MMGFIHRGGFPRPSRIWFGSTEINALAVRRGWDSGRRLLRSEGSNSSTSKEGRKEGGRHHFRWSQVWLQWSVGMIVSTPIIALLQGTILLNEYRVRHSDAPIPVMPARGVAVAIDDDEDGKKQHQPSMGRLAEASWKLRRSLMSSSSSSSSQQQDQPPLRLLVVGDSLAAGVGMSKSGVPILPESIARALSKALNGRAVYWTCVGTPGVAARQLVEDINDIEPHDPHPKARQVERIVKEFQARRRRWQERRAKQKQEQHREIDHKDSNQADGTDGDSSQEQPNAIVQWWKQGRAQDNLTPAEILRATRDVATNWWTATRNKFRKRKEQVAEDFSVIKEIVLEPLPKLDDDADDYYYDYYRENLKKEGMANESDDFHKHEEPRLPMVNKGSIFRRTSVNPGAAAEYDVAIVLIGLNDVKYAFMPHMSGGMNDSTPPVGGLKNELFRVLQALQAKMGPMDLDLKDNGDGEVPTSASSHEMDSSSSDNRLKRPLVVVPELPVAPLQLFRLVPLKWFLVPIFRAMENNKRFLAKTFPDYVLFVDQPDLHWWTDDVGGIGPVRENIQQEKLLLRATDTAQAARDRIRGLMEKYYTKKKEEIAMDQLKSDQQKHRSSTQSAIENENNIQMMDDEDHDHFDASASDRARDPANQVAHLLSIDRVHPNDDGYELWGRHIAGAIIEHWNKN